MNIFAFIPSRRLNQSLTNMACQIAGGSVATLNWNITQGRTLLPISSPAQNTVTQTLDVNVIPLGGLFMQASPLALTKLNTGFNSFTGALTLSYRARTRQGSGQGTITVKATSDFSPSGGPSIANPPSSTDKFTYTCSGATLGIACSGTQTVSTTAATNVVSLGASDGKTWSLMAGASTSSFSGCTTVPVSAITIKCVSASVDGSGQSSAGCSMNNFTSLPNTLPGLPVASGNEGSAGTHGYPVVLSYQLADSWRYIANTCPLNVSYTVITQ